MFILLRMSVAGDLSPLSQSLSRSLSLAFLSLVLLVLLSTLFCFLRIKYTYFLFYLLFLLLRLLLIFLLIFFHDILLALLYFSAYVLLHVTYLLVHFQTDGREDNFVLFMFGFLINHFISFHFISFLPLLQHLVLSYLYPSRNGQLALA